MKLHISESLSLPIDAATQTFAFIARKGAGKTYAAGKLAEELMAAKVQCVILDTVGNWYGLRLSADGKKEGFDIPVLGGLRGDIPLEATGGELVADLIVDTGRSVIVDVSQFSQADRKRFATAFGVRLWQRKKAEQNPSPLHLIIEECQLIVPQFVGRDDARMVGIYEELIRLGRNYGIGVSMITQRPQSVNKEVLTQTECLVVLQVNGTPERKAIREWVVHQGMDVNLLNELPSLPIGTAYIWSPQWLGILEKVKIGKKQTFDASATPKVGEHRQQRELAPLDLESFKQKMAATIERAKENDPTELKHTIIELKRKLAKSEQAAPQVQTQEVEVPILDHDAKNLLNKILNACEGVREAAREKGIHFQGLTRQLTELNERIGLSLRNMPKAAASKPHIVHPQRERIGTTKRATNGHLPIGEAKILRALIQHPDGLKREQLTVLTGYKRSSRDAYIARLRDRDYISTEGEEVLVNTNGQAALPDAAPLPSGEELQDYYRTRLPQGELAILEQLIAAYPKSLNRESLSETTEYKRSSRDAYIARLRARELLTEPSRGEVRASDHLF